MMNFNNTFLNSMFRSIFLATSGGYYKNTKVQMWFVGSPSTHNLRLAPNSIPHRIHITYSLFKTVYHTVYTSPRACSKQYTTQSTHHLQLVPNSIPHSLHITYSLYQPVYHTVYTSPRAFQTVSHTVYTSPTACSNQ